MGLTGALGPIPFIGGQGSAASFHKLTKVRKQNYVRHKIVMSNDLIEATGPEPIEINLAMMFFAPYTLPPSAAIAAVEAVMDQQIPLPLIIGGTPVGRGLLTLFVIEEVQSNMDKFVDANCVHAEINVKLLEFPNPPANAGPLSALSTGLPGLSNIVASVNNLASGITGGISGALAGVSGITGALSGVTNVIGQVNNITGTVTGAISSVTGAVNSVASIGNNISNAIGNLTPGNVIQVTQASAAQVQTAIANAHAAGF